MSEVIALKRPDPDRVWGDNRYVSLAVKGDSVTLLNSQLRRGINKHSGKTWARFEGSRRTFKRTFTTDGQQRVNVWIAGQGIWKQVQNSTPKVDRLPKSSDNIAHIAKFFEVMGHDAEPTVRNLEVLCYPILAHNDKWHYAAGLGSALRMADTRDFVEAAFGKTRYRKDLVRSISNTDSLTAVSIAAMWRGLVPTDWLVDAAGTPIRAIRNENYVHHVQSSSLSGKDIIALRKILANMNLGSRKRLLVSALDDPYVIDTVRSARLILREGEQLPVFGKIDGWRNAHDLLATQARKIGQENRKIDQSSKPYKKLDGKVTPLGYRIVSAKETHELLDWGAVMNNCIGSYGHMATNGSTNLFAIFQGEALVGNMEVGTNGAVRQLVGKNNARFADYRDVADFVENELSKK